MDTNQRLSFDIDPWGRYLAAGDNAGGVKIWGIAGDNWGEQVWGGQVGDGESRMRYWLGVT